jgi:hypothetical protein
MRRSAFLVLTTLGLFLLGSTSAFACGGLVSPNGTINLVRTTTLAGYRNGIEHYVTSFAFAGGGDEVGSIVPLPGVPTKVIRGGDWTLQRLLQEVQPPAPEASFLAADAAGAERSAVEVILETKIDALEITILKGGGDEVGEWAKDHGFALPPDAPEVLDFYAARSPIFMAARFDAKAARDLGQASGDGTPIHLVIPTERPWVPLRILGLGRQPIERVEADVFLLTAGDEAPALLPEAFPADFPVQPDDGLFLQQSSLASEGLLADLRSDKGMKWIPKTLDGMWLSYLTLDASAESLTYDLAIDATGAGQPSPVDAGLVEPGGERLTPGSAALFQRLAIVAAAGAVMLMLLLARRRGGRAAV